MVDIQDRIKTAFSFSKLLEIDSIKEEVTEGLIGYTPENVEFKNGEYTCSYVDKNNRDLILTISLNKISLLKSTDNIVESIEINEELILYRRTVEKRENGLIYSVIEKQFAPSERFGNRTVLVDLAEKRYILTKNTLNALANNIDFKNDRLIKLLLKLRILETNIDLKEKSDYYSNFSTHMNYYMNWYNGRKLKNNIYPTKTYLNDQNISNMYDIEGADKLYRVYDLYRGVINSRNEADIKLIHLNILSPDIFDLKGLKGITEKEDSLVGKSLENFPEEYLKYLKQLLHDRFGYDGNLSLNRESILRGILGDPNRLDKPIEVDRLYSGTDSFVEMSGDDVSIASRFRFEQSKENADKCPEVFGLDDPYGFIENYHRRIEKYNDITNKNDSKTPSIGITSSKSEIFSRRLKRMIKKGCKKKKNNK